MSVESEAAVIGCIVLDNAAVKYCSDLTPEMFSHKRLKFIYGRCLALIENNKPVNAAELVTSCRNKQLTDDQISQTVIQCLDKVSTAAEIKSHVSNIIADYKTLRVKTFFADGINNVYPSNVDKVIRDISDFADQVSSGTDKSSHTAKEISEKYKPLRFTDKKADKLYLGFNHVDNATGGIEPSDVVVVGARPSVGKTAIVIQIICNMCRAGKRVGYYNLEMSDGQIYDRFISHLSGIPLDRIRNGTAFLNDEKDLYEKANAEYASYQLTVISDKTCVSDIKISARHMDYDVIVIDYLQLLKPDRKYESRSSEVGDISKSIKDIARSFGIPVILLSQLNRASEGRDSKEPSMSELRESGDIEQDASVIILLWNISERKEKKGLKIEKDRQGKLGRYVLDFDGAHQTFTETDQTVKQATEEENLKGENPFENNTGGSEPDFR